MMENKKMRAEHSKKELAVDILYDIIGSILFGAGIYTFAEGGNFPLFKAVPADSYKTESDTCSLSSRQVSDSCDGGIPKRDCGSGAGCDETVCV